VAKRPAKLRLSNLFAPREFEELGEDPTPFKRKAGSAPHSALRATEWVAKRPALGALPAFDQ
jgi:hypothetical protein